MTNIPHTAQEFERWFAAQPFGDWPADLFVKAERALLALKSMNQKAFNESEVMQRECAKDLMAFAEAYGAWKASL